MKERMHASTKPFHSYTSTIYKVITFDFTGHKMAKTRILSKWLTKLTHPCCVLSLF